MAGDWIKIRLDLDEDPAVIGLVERTGLVLDCVLGKLFRCWRWFNRQSRNGHASVTLLSLDSYLGVTGFAQAMVDVAWLEVHPDGHLSIPKFDRHNGKSAKKRALAAARQEQARSRRKRDESVTGALPEKRREEKRREEEKRPLPPPPSRERGQQGEPEAVSNIPIPPEVAALVLPACLRTEAFREKWAEYLQHRIDSRSPLTKAAAKHALARLEKWGEARAIAALIHTMGQGWLGIKEEGGAAGQPAANKKSREQARKEVFDEWLRTRETTAPGASTTPTASPSRKPTANS